jgi:voltage-gated potassium channel
MEHDHSTNLLWAITHLDEELETRPSLIDLPDKDLEHIAGDIRRLYDHLTTEWLDYVQQLKSNYPFLFSLVLRTHPFQEQQSPIIT